MREPFAQFRTRRDFFHPGTEVRPFLGDAARPESVDQYSIAIGGCRGIVDAFNFNVAHGGSLSVAVILATYDGEQDFSEVGAVWSGCPERPADSAIRIGRGLPLECARQSRR